MSMPNCRTCEYKYQLKSSDSIQYIVEALQEKYEITKIIKTTEINQNTFEEIIQNIEIQCIDNTQIMPITEVFKINKNDYLVIDKNVYEVLSDKKFYADFIKPIEHMLNAYSSMLG